MEKEFSPEFQGVVQHMSGLMGLTSAFKEKYGDEAIEVTKDFAEKMGTIIGNRIKEGAGISGSGIEDMEKVFRGFLSMAKPPHEFELSVEGNTLTMKREMPAVCPGLIAAKRMGIPPDMFCNTITIPIWTGVAKSVNPDAVHASELMSEQKCIESIEIP
ncbi:MAG: hypothetical protein HXS46_01935 [Theionarchaea archaeon]|nr:MAG: hypothetical protein AYK18_13975 [Theionarchaea archaeon DG-70]MBU7009422.1 hypothetical protein [Theionarchaea archaeon]